MGGKCSDPDYHRKYYLRNREKLKAKATANYEKKKDTPKHKTYAKEYRDRLHFGTTRDEIFAKTKGKCFRCKKRKATVVHHKDHDGLSSIPKGHEPGKNPKRLIGMCRTCHMKLHWQEIKAARTAVGGRGIPLPEGRWSWKHDRCRKCHRTDRRHSAHGYCLTCIVKIRKRRRESGV